MLKFVSLFIGLLFSVVFVKEMKKRGRYKEKQKVLFKVLSNDSFMNTTNPDVNEKNSKGC